MTSNYYGTKCGQCQGSAGAHRIDGPVVVQLPSGGTRIVTAHGFVFSGKSR